MKKLTVGAALLAALALALSGCAQPPASSTLSGGDASSSDFLACMVSDAGGFDDKSFNESGYNGLKQAESELGVKIQTAESKNANDFTPNLKNMVSQNCGLTITVGFNLAEATKAQATETPDAKFAIVDDESIDLPNVKPLVFKTSDAAFLAGYLAAGYSKSGIVGTFGGIAIPSVTIFMDGFADGIAQYNADNGKSVKLLGWDKDKQDGLFTGDFEDESKGQNTTKQFIDQGADVVMPVAGPVGNGAAAAAKAAGDVAIIWVDSDGYETNPTYKDLFLTSVMKQIGPAVYDSVKEASSDAFTSTKYVGTLANGGVGIAPYHDFDSKVDAALKQQIEDYTAKIVSGEYKVTSPGDPTA
ncbi:MAG: BMP family ABC transporter substrate-binding protein [Propionibacteriaceae bacterium]|nr:BMP family ABC transporter substrate-binding protein [Propionibacteriaceae bacterium]